MRKSDAYVSAGQVFVLPTGKQSFEPRHVQMIKVFIA